jgi:hypothetical protein
LTLDSSPSWPYTGSDVFHASQAHHLPAMASRSNIRVLLISPRARV